MTKVVKDAVAVTCNRCGYEDLWDSFTPDYLKWEWGEFSQGEEGKGRISVDLCPICTREVKNWIRNGR